MDRFTNNQAHEVHQFFQSDVGSQKEKTSASNWTDLFRFKTLTLAICLNVCVGPSCLLERVQWPVFWIQWRGCLWGSVCNLPIKYNGNGPVVIAVWWHYHYCGCHIVQMTGIHTHLHTHTHTTWKCCMVNIQATFLNSLYFFFFYLNCIIKCRQLLIIVYFFHVKRCFYRNKAKKSVFVQQILSRTFTKCVFQNLATSLKLKRQDHYIFLVCLLLQWVLSHQLHSLSKGVKWSETMLWNLSWNIWIFVVFSFLSPLLTK